MPPRNVPQKKSILELIESGVKDKASFSAEEYYNELKTQAEQHKHAITCMSNMKKTIFHLEKSYKELNMGLSLLQDVKTTGKISNTKKETAPSTEDTTK